MLMYTRSSAIGRRAGRGRGDTETIISTLLDSKFLRHREAMPDLAVRFSFTLRYIAVPINLGLDGVL